MKSLNKFDNLLGAVINKTAIRMRLELSKLLSENNLDITVDQYVVLNRIFEHEGISQSDLAYYTYKDKASITRIIDLLEKKNYVERRAVVGNRRTYQVHALPKAIKLKSKLRHLASENINRGTKNISEEDVEILIETLNKIHDNYV